MIEFDSKAANVLAINNASAGAQAESSMYAKLRCWELYANFPPMITDIDSSNRANSAAAAAMEQGAAASGSSSNELWRATVEKEGSSGGSDNWRANNNIAANSSGL